MSECQIKGGEVSRIEAPRHRGASKASAPKARVVAQRTAGDAVDAEERRQHAHAAPITFALRTSNAELQQQLLISYEAATNTLRSCRYQRLLLIP